MNERLVISNLTSVSAGIGEDDVICMGGRLKFLPGNGLVSLKLEIAIDDDASQQTLITIQAHNGPCNLTVCSVAEAITLLGCVVQNVECRQAIVTSPKHESPSVLKYLVQAVAQGSWPPENGP